MSIQQQLNEQLETLLGALGRAVWLAIRVDDKTVSQVARELRIPTPQVRRILLSADWALEHAKLAPEEPPRTALRTNWNGFHQLGDEQ